MRWFGRQQPTPAQNDAEAQARWSDWSRAIGEGRVLGKQSGFAPVQEGFFQRLGKALRPGGVEYRTLVANRREMPPISGEIVVSGAELPDETLPADGEQKPAAKAKGKKK